MTCTNVAPSVCSVCGIAAHASETDDQDRCADCSDASTPMRALLDEQLDHLRGALHPGDTLANWYADGMEFAHLNLGDDTHREACAFAMGYLRGAAEMADLTLGQLLEEHNLTFNAPQPTRRSRARKAR